MKKDLVRRLLLFFSLLMLFNSCSLWQNDDETTVVFDLGQFEDKLKSGTWKVSSFRIDGSNEAHLFNGYRLEFADNGAIIAMNASSSASGSWFAFHDEEYDGYLEIYFSTVGDFPQMNGEWFVENYSNSQIKLHNFNSTSVESMILVRN